MQNTPTQADNLLNRVGRLYIDNRQFTDDNGKTIDYQRLVMEIVVKDKIVNIETKLEQKDYILLDLADTKPGSLS